ncbi:MAG: hydrogenase iron-sulfur subunit [Anaerolineae bacterium]|jgi:coenzyme F420-reducing hydrogenase delta subunit
MSDSNFEPELTAFTCIYCGSMAADTAGALRLTYPANVKLFRFPCTGKVDVEYILKAFEEGADGVYIVACSIGNCHHVNGNVRATKRLDYARELLEQVGIEGERLGIFYMSGSQAHAFASAATQMTERIRRLGPSPLRKEQSREPAGP